MGDEYLVFIVLSTVIFVIIFGFTYFLLRKTNQRAANKWLWVGGPVSLSLLWLWTFLTGKYYFALLTNVSNFFVLFIFGFTYFLLKKTNYPAANKWLWAGGPLLLSLLWLWTFLTDTYWDFFSRFSLLSIGIFLFIFGFIYLFLKKTNQWTADKWLWAGGPVSLSLLSLLSFVVRVHLGTYLSLLISAFLCVPFLYFLFRVPKNKPEISSNTKDLPFSQSLMNNFQSPDTTSISESVAPPPLPVEDKPVQLRSVDTSHKGYNEQVIAAPKKTADQIFICYRRSDSPGAAGRIYDRLIQRFGRSAVFKDVDSIPLGVNFKQHLDRVVQQCSVVLVIIGEKWLEKEAGAEQRRIDDPRDFVRIEIESALKREIPIIPLLIENGTLPSEEELPITLQELAFRHGMEVGNDPYFHTDIDRLIKYLETLFNNESNPQQQ